MRYAEQYRGSCPSYVQKPFKKTLNISFIGINPYITYKPFGGSDVLVTKILGKKFGFVPKFIPTKSFDIVQENETTYGMVYRVRTKGVT